MQAWQDAALGEFVFKIDHYTFKHAGSEKVTELTEITSRPIDPKSPPPNWRLVNEIAANK